MRRFDPESVVLKVDGVEIEWSRITYEDRPMAHIPARLAMSESAISNLMRRETALTAKFVNDPFIFRPTDKIWLTSSHKPQVRATGDGIWKRFLSIISRPHVVQLRIDDLAVRLAMYLAVEWSR